MTAQTGEQQLVVPVENGELQNNAVETPTLGLDGLVISDNHNEKEELQDNTETAKDGNDEKSNGKGNEEKKIFCGGISYDCSSEDLTAYFAQFGPVKEAQVKYDRMTGRSRGFAFVEFDTLDGCKASLVQREQTIKGKQCEIKPAKTRDGGYMNKKVFVGGLPGDFPEEELRKHFEQFGRVEDVEWPFDKMNKTRKSFAFVVFEAEDGADRAAASPKQQFSDRENIQCDVKKAVPQMRRNNNNFPPRGNGNNIRGVGGFAGGPIVAGMRAPQHHQMPMYHQNQWYQMNAAAAWYNAAYNGGAMYGYGGHGGQGTGANGNNSAAHWYNSGGANGHHGVTAPQANQWYGNWYGNNNGNNSAPAIGTANDMNGGGTV